MTLATIFAVLAFVISLLALWLTSDIVKKVEGQNEKFVRAHISTLRQEMRDMDKVITKTTRLAKGHKELLSGADGRLNEQAKTLESLHARVAQLSAELAALDQSIPPRFRKKTALEPRAKAAEKKAP